MANEDQRAHWDERAEAWDEQASWMDEAVGEHGSAARRALAAQPGERVIDLGCGAGLSAVALGREVGTDGFVAAVDLSSAMAEATGRRLADAGVSGQAIAADAQTDDLAAAGGDGRPFDAAHSRFGVMFFSDPPAAFTNIARCLRSGGRFAASAWKDLSANDWMAVPTITAIGPLGVEELPLPEPGAPGPFTLADPDATTELLTGAGFADVAVDSVDSPFVVGRDVRKGIVQMLRAGPLSDAYDAAAEDVRSGAVDAVEAALEPYRAGEGYRIPAGSWTITARRP